MAGGLGVPTKYDQELPKIKHDIEYLLKLELTQCISGRDFLFAAHMKENLKP